MPEISILTPSLNQAGYLRQALASVAGQRGVAAEHLVFDPGSWDGARALLRAWEQGGPNRRVFLERDAGPAEALNKGLAAARGDIVGWLCADDLYPAPETLASVCAAFAADPEADVVYGRALFIDAQGRAIGPAPFLADPALAVKTLRAQEPFVQPAAFVRRALIDRIGPFDPRFGLAYDVEFWLRAIAAGAKLRAIEPVLAHKRIHADALTKLLPGVRAMDCARAVRAHLGAAGPAWPARAIAAEVAHPGAEADKTAAAVQRRLDRPGPEKDMLVVLGNGPSLAGFDFEALRGLDAIGMNAAYRHWRRIGWHPRYYACLDLIVGLSHRQEIEAMVNGAERLGIDAFLLRGNLIRTLDPEARNSPRVIDFDRLSAPGGLLDLLPVTTGSHAALFGALLGYRTLALLGVDCNYVERVEGAEPREGIELELVSTPAHNPNYYFADYQQAGDRYNIPNPSPGLHVESWRAAGVRLRARGVEVWNASKRSRLDAFARRPFAALAARQRAGAW